MFKVVTEEEKDNIGKFVIEPLEAGLGHTMGNSLRRVLLTSLDGAAITSVKIDGVSHQYSTINGVIEDVIEIILNLKKVRVKVFDKPIKLKLYVSGKKEVKAQDIEVIGEGEIVNPTFHIATLTSPQAKLNMEMTAEKGKGYQTTEEKKLDEIGVLPMDALFSPVIDVNYSVEPTRVGRKTDFDKLILEIRTDGIITPTKALNDAAKLLSATFKQVFEPAPEEESAEDAGQLKISEEVLKMSVDELDLPVRITNALRAVDVETVEQLISVPRQQLLKAKNLGGKSISLVSEKLAERGLILSEA